MSSESTSKLALVKEIVVVFPAELVKEVHITWISLECPYTDEDDGCLMEQTSILPEIHIIMKDGLEVTEHVETGAE